MSLTRNWYSIINAFRFNETDKITKEEKKKRNLNEKNKKQTSKKKKQQQQLKQCLIFLRYYHSVSSCFLWCASFLDRTHHRQFTFRCTWRLLLQYLNNNTKERRQSSVAQLKPELNKTKKKQPGTSRKIHSHSFLCSIS